MRAMLTILAPATSYLNLLPIFEEARWLLKMTTSVVVVIVFETKEFNAN